MRTIIIGDIHGCHEEFEMLLEKIAPGPQDELICVGDLVCKGPFNAKTLDLAMSLPNFTSTLGNQDYNLATKWRTTGWSGLKESQRVALVDMGGNIERYIRYLENLPVLLRRADFDVLHAGVKPRRKLEEQRVEDLLNLRELEDGVPWFEQYEEERLIVFGHWSKLGLVDRPNALGLDTGCVYGGQLTACVMPERELISVNARGAYAKRD